MASEASLSPLFYGVSIQAKLVKAAATILEYAAWIAVRTKLAQGQISGSICRYVSQQTARAVPTDCVTTKKELLWR